MSKKHRKETQKIGQYLATSDESNPAFVHQIAAKDELTDGKTDHLKRRLARWAMAINWFLREARTIVLGVVSIAVASAVAYNHFHSASLHQTTKDQLGQLWHHVHELENRLDDQPKDDDSVGKNTDGTNVVAVMKERKNLQWNGHGYEP